MIYFITDGDGFVKIGHSAKSSGNRLAHLQTGNARALRILFEVDGDQKLERKLHHAFWRWRVRREWFSNEGGIADLLTKLEAAAPEDRSAIVAGYRSQPILASKPRFEESGFDKEAERKLFHDCLKDWIGRNGFNSLQSVGGLSLSQARNLNRGISVPGPITLTRLMTADPDPFAPFFGCDIQRKLAA